MTLDDLTDVNCISLCNIYNVSIGVCVNDTVIASLSQVDYQQVMSSVLPTISRDYSWFRAKLHAGPGGQPDLDALKFLLKDEILQLLSPNLKVLLPFFPLITLKTRNMFHYFVLFLIQMCYTYVFS